MMMTMKNATKAFLFCVLFLISLFFTWTGASAESREQERRWSFAFDDCTVSEALSQIAKVTKREIRLEGETDNKVGRSYENEGLEEIIRDILRNENYILAMFPGDGDIGSVKIWLLGKSGHGANNLSTASSRSNKGPLRDKKRYERTTAFSKRHSRNIRRKEPSFRSTEGLAPPEPEKRLDLESPPMPPGLPMPGR